MVVMGGWHNSNRKKTKDQIDSRLKDKVQAELTVKATIKKGKLKIDASAKKTKGSEIPASARVFAVIAQDGLVTECPKGENAGRTLNEGSIVRTILEGKKLSKKLKWEVDVAKDWKADDLRVVIFVQDSEDWKVYEATQAKVSKKKDY